MLIGFICKDCGRYNSKTWHPEIDSRTCAFCSSSEEILDDNVPNISIFKPFVDVSCDQPREISSKRQISEIEKKEGKTFGSDDLAQEAQRNKNCRILKQSMDRMNRIKDHIERYYTCCNGGW
jgi:hypothetical protein